MLANLAMMNVQPSEGASLDLWEYEALLSGWNAAHSTGDEVEAPDPDVALALIDRINSDPRLTH